MNYLKYLLFLLSTNLFAQTGNLDFSGEFISGSANELIFKTVKEGFHVIQSDYIMLSPKTGKEYGRAGNKYFGRKYTIGVTIDSQIILPQHSIEPWRGDGIVMIYDTLQPKLFQVATRQFSVLDFSIQKIIYDSIRKVHLISMPKLKGFSKSNQSLSNGYFISYYLNQQGDSFSIKPAIKKVNLEWKNIDKLEIIGFQLIESDLLGSFLFIENVTLGNINYQPIGQYELINSKWVFNTFQKTESVEKPKPKDELTPIEKPKVVIPVEEPKGKKKSKKDKSKSN